MTMLVMARRRVRPFVHGEVLHLAGGGVMRGPALGDAKVSSWLKGR